MAGERKGRIYEALTVVALQELAKQTRLPQIFWNETPSGMSIEPDISLGRSKDDPSILLLITHSGSSKKSGMKFWRNLGELVEAKTRLRSIPAVFSIAFDPIIYGGLKEIQAVSFDGQLVVGERSYFPAMLGWANQSIKHFPKGAESQKDFVISELNSGRRGDFFDGFKTDLMRLLHCTNPQNDSLWRRERSRSTPAIRSCRTTHVRRGLSKLLVFEDLQMVLDLFRGRKRRNVVLPSAAYWLELFARSIGGPRPKDIEIKSVVESFDDTTIKSLLAYAPVHQMSDWMAQLRHADLLPAFGRYVLENAEAVSNPARLFVAVRELHRDPYALIADSARGCEPPKSVWLIEYLIEIVKLGTGQANGYGHAQLAREVIDNGFGSQRDLTSASQFGGGIGFPAWIRRNRTPFREELIQGVCAVLAQRLAKFDREKLAKLVELAPQQIVRNTLETKILTYYKFDPIGILVEQRIGNLEAVCIRSCFAERASSKGLAGASQIARARETLINWQSASDAGRDHKKKELCGRAVGLRYSWDGNKGRFVRRPGAKKLVLVLDGTWRQEDLVALTRAGWDEIFYPDEMEQLAAAIV